MKKKEQSTANVCDFAFIKTKNDIPFSYHGIHHVDYELQFKSQIIEFSFWIILDFTLLSASIAWDCFFFANFSVK